MEESNVRVCYNGVMKKRISLFFLGSFLFLCFIFFSSLAHKDFFTQFDFDATVRLQDNISRRFDVWFSLLSLIGSFEIATVFLLVLLFIRRKLRGFFALFLYVTMHLIEIFGKALITHLGPPFMFYRYAIDFIFPSTYVKPGYSYPSGHAARTAFISVVLLSMLLRSKKLSHRAKLVSTLFVLTFDVLMFASRVYLGEHWSSDVIGGGLLGISLGVLSFLL